MQALTSDSCKIPFAILPSIITNTTSTILQPIETALQTNADAMIPTTPQFPTNANDPVQMAFRHLVTYYKKM